jgi:hypothetical protein
MSWNLTVTNDYAYPVTALGTTINPKASHTFSNTLGNAILTVPGLGAVNFIDVGDVQIGGYSHATWGVLISYQGEEVVFRYEGGGQIQVTLTWLGQAQLAGNGAFSQISLPSFILPGGSGA